MASDKIRNQPETQTSPHLIGGSRALSIQQFQQPMKASGISYEKPMDPLQITNDTLILLDR